MKRSLVWGTVLVLLIIVGGIAYWGIRAVLTGADQPVAIPPEKVADYVHAVIEANRTVYATNVVDKMQEKGIVEAAEHWRQENALPLPAQFLIDTGRLVAERGLGIKYRLASLSPIYVWNNAQSDFERKGLEAVATNPERPYT
ncbi:MAG: Tll0287-like domain-containing protein, partial [Nitrospiraceae bacterium]